jgi:hypothetical protein
MEDFTHQRGFLELERSASIDALAKALVQLQAKLPKVTKDKDNPFFRSKYADQASIMDAIQEPMSQAGLAVINTMDYDDMFPDSILIRTTLVHESGQWISGITKMQVATKDKHPTPQEIGSMITYGRRYGISAMIGLAAEDDDGALASGTVAVAAPKTSKKEAMAMAKEVFPTAEEVTLETLQKKLREAGVGVVKVLSHYKVGTLEELTKEQIVEAYQRAVNSIKKA